VERGNHIRIGLNWFYGGALSVADHMNYYMLAMLWGELDFRSLDKTIKMQLLAIYTSMAGYYYKKDGDWRIYDKIRNRALRSLCMKIFHVYGGLWRILFGVMPSGAYETSHGDSWIVLFIYFLFFCTVMEEYPQYEQEIMAYLTKKIISIMVYGDDSLYCYPKRLAHILSIHKFAHFVEVYFDMKCRDVEEYDSLFSDPDLRTGTFMRTEKKKKRSVFLQISFVKREDVTTRTDVCKVLPYRSFRKTYTKFAFGKGSERVHADGVMTATGMAYMSMGTNRMAYEFARFMYEYFLSKCGNMTYDEIFETYGNNHDLTTLMRKQGMSIHELSQGFPTIDHLLDMHVYNDNYAPSTDFVKTAV
jgi:hypothetical protein